MITNPKRSKSTLHLLKAFLDILIAKHNIRILHQSLLGPIKESHDIDDFTRDNILRLTFLAWQAPGYLVSFDLHNAK